MHARVMKAFKNKYEKQNNMKCICPLLIFLPSPVRSAVTGDGSLATVPDGRHHGSYSPGEEGWS